VIHLAKEKPKNGKLIQVFPSGTTIVLASNLPFPELQKKKKAYIMRGFNANTLKVTYLDKDKKNG
jgi:hypothetical protein